MSAALVEAWAAAHPDSGVVPVLFECEAGTFKAKERHGKLGLLEARGERRGRHYVAGEPLREIQKHLRAERKPLEDPYPTLRGEIRRALP